MSATIGRQQGLVQLEQSNMRLALNMAKVANEGFARTSIEETQQIIKKPDAEIREENKRGVLFRGHNKRNGAIARHLAMVWQNQTDCCLHSQNDTAKNQQTRWRH